MGAAPDAYTEKLRRRTKTMTSVCVYERKRRPNIPKEVRERVLREKGPGCVACGVLPGALRGKPLKPVVMTMDHIWPHGRGGCSHFHNLQPMCEDCNTEKGDRMPGADFTEANFSGVAELHHHTRQRSTL